MSDTSGSSGNNDINITDLNSVAEPSKNDTNRRKSKRRREANDLIEHNLSDVSTSLVASTSSISGHTLASLHSKLRKVNTSSGGSAKADLQTTETDQDVTKSPLPSSHDGSESPFSDTPATDGRVTRSRLRAMQQAANSSSNSPSPTAHSGKSIFAQGKDKIAKKGRDLLKKAESKKKKVEHSESPESLPYSAASVIVRMNNRHASGSTSSSTDTLEPTPGGSARTTPYDLQSSTNPVINPSRINLRNFGFTSTIGIPSNNSTNQLNTNLSNTATGLLMSRNTTRASFLGTLVPRMQHLLGSGSPAMSATNCGMTQSNSRYSSILEGLKSTNDIRQTEAANELAELLLMGNEESLPNLPIREIVTQLMSLMQKENNLELILISVRCISNMQEALPRAMPILLETVPLLLRKLKHIECIDIAEQTLIALEVMSRRNAKTILHAGGFSDAVMHVDFFSVPSQRLVYQIAANCASYIGVNDFALIRSCLPDLTQKLTFDDKRCCESICTFFYRLIEIFRNSSEKLREIAGTNYEFLMKIQQLLMIQPSTINSSTFVHLLKSVRYMCIRCFDIVSALIDKDFGRTLKFLLVGNEKEGNCVDITLRPTQHTREIIALVGELLPPLPKIDIFEISSTVIAYMNNHVPLSGNILITRENTTVLPVTISWQYEDDAGDMIDFSTADIAMLEGKRTSGSSETYMDIGGYPCLVDLTEMRYTNTRTSYVGRIDRRTTGFEQEDPSAERDADRERHNNRLLELIKIHFPLLVEIGTATSCSNLRYEATRTMMRMIYSIESEAELKLVLNNLPLASYIFSTLSSNKGLAVSASALQLIHVLLEKLPRLYVPLFEAEGIFHMMQVMIRRHHKEDKILQPERPDRKVINLRRGPIEISTASSSNVQVVTEQQIDVVSTNETPSTASNATNYAQMMRSVATNDPSTSFANMIPVGGQGNYVPMLYQNYIAQQNSTMELSGLVGNLTNPTELAYVMQHHQLSTAYVPNIQSLKKQSAEKIAEWMHKEQKYLIDKYHGKGIIYDLDKTILVELFHISKQLAKNSDAGMKPLEDLASLLMKKEVSAFQLNHSRVQINLCNYLVDDSESRVVPRSTRLKRFARVFMNLREELGDDCRPLNINGEMFKPFEKLVTKVVHSVGQMEQFQIKVTNLNGVLSNSSTNSASSNMGTVLRGSQALRFFQTHQIRCNLKRHPTCKSLREWRHGRGSIKVDPFTSVSAIEKYLIDRGVGSNITDSSSDNDDGSDDDDNNDVEGSSDSLSGTQQVPDQPFTGKIEILIGEQPIPSDLSILQAICQYSLTQDDDQEGIPNSVWVSAHTLYFRVAATKNDAESNANSKKRSKSSGKKSSKHDKTGVFYTANVPVRKNPLEAYLKSKLDIQLKDACTESCTLLRVLYGLNKYWYEIFNTQYEQILPKTYEPILPVSIFHSPKLNAKVQRQLGDFLSVATQQIPLWTTNIVKAVPFMFPFDVRRNMLYCTAFGRERALMHLVTEGSDEHDNEATSRLVPRLERRKVTIKRNNLLGDAVATFHQMHTSKAQLEVNFDGEIGTGFGPTLEFYSTVSKEIQKHSLGIWNGSCKEIVITDEGEAEQMTVNAHGLYPISMGRHQRSQLPATTNKLDGRGKRFDFIGRLLAQTLLDSRMLDIPFSPIFFKWLLHEEDTMGLADLFFLDPLLYKSLKEIQNEKSQKNLDSMELYFTMPGDDNFELKKSGKNEKVTLKNVHQFVSLVTYWKLIEGVKDEMLSLRHGFEQVIDPQILQIFSCDEMEQLFCGCSEGTNGNDKVWSKSALQQAIRPDHGYTHESQQIVWLVEMLHGFSIDDRRKFLQFCTGSPRLPVGGFRGLHPPLTVVRKVVSFGMEGELPSAMTCYNFLKIPPYSTYEMFVERFKVALQFIYSFHLT